MSFLPVVQPKHSKRSVLVISWLTDFETFDIDWLDLSNRFFHRLHLGETFSLPPGGRAMWIEQRIYLVWTEKIAFELFIHSLPDASPMGETFNHLVNEHKLAICSYQSESDDS